MTSAIETLETNEFLRRRKLRLQQVREQSKEIARKLRIRAKVEKLRHIVELDDQKENDYLDRQERLVEQLEQVYARGRRNAGAGHKQAFVEKSHVVATVAAASTGTGVTKSDKSKIRAREATAELRQKKQEELDKKNRLLRRKLKAREAANEISREKCKTTSNSKEPSAQGTEGSEPVLRRHSPHEVQCEINNEQAESKAVETDRIVLEDKPVSASILKPDSSAGPPCSTGKPDNPQPGGDAQLNRTPTKTNRKDNCNTFHSKITQDCEKNNLAAKGRNDMGTQWDNEFIPNEWVPTVPKLKLPDDDKGSTMFIDAGVSKPRKPSNLFAVSDDMPSGLRSKRAYSPPLAAQSRSSLTLVSEYLHQRQLRLREHDAPGPSRRRETGDLQNCKQTIVWARSTHNEAHAANLELKTVSLENDKANNERRKKNNVTMYNHFTKDKRDIPGADSDRVLRDVTPAEDAYSIAMRQSEGFEDRPRHERPKASQNRSRIASDKQTVEKEYQDTMAFLNSLAKEQTNNRRPIKKAYMNEDRQQNLEERHQRKMQHEYRNIEKDAMRRQAAAEFPSKDTQGRRRKSPGKTLEGHPSSSQYSWMPVPDSDPSLVVHTIPTTAKGAHDVKNVDGVDCYHEYRSRHKHTPPTRDKHSNHRAAEPDSRESEHYSSHESRTSENDSEDDGPKKTAKDCSDAERIIVYKILETKRKKGRKKARFAGDRVHSMTAVRDKLLKTRKVVTESRGSLEHLNEGVYKNVAPKGDNIQSLYFPASHDKNLSGDLTVDGNKKGVHAQERDIRQMQWDCGDKVPDERSTGPTAKCPQSTTSHVPPKVTRLTLTKSSMSGGYSVTTDQETVQSNTENPTTDNGYVKLVGDNNQETEKLILGAAGLLNDDGYEVVIQLRKKDTGKKSDEQAHQLKDNPSQDLEGVTEATTKLVKTVSSQNTLPYSEHALEEKISAQSQPTHDTEPNPTQTKASDKDQEYAGTTRQTACTQTSLHTPSQRSLMLMSSSTSTAYMSPPEVILPACLKHNLQTNRDKLSDSFKSYSIKNQCTKKHVKCRCRKCTHVKRADAYDQKIIDAHVRKSTPQVPPNTARSEAVIDVNNMPARECTCPKCGCDKRTKSNLKRRNRRYHQSWDKDNAVRKKTAATTKLCREELNPIIKDYVKRLLTLNKQGLKAIEVLNQECSSVTTPGSSIINIDSNVEDKRSAEAKLPLEHLKNILLMKIDEESKKPISKTQTHRKKRPIHKIKSLNISKHLLRKKSDSESTSKPAKDARLPSSTSTKDDSEARLQTMVWNRSPKHAEHKKVLEEQHSEASISSVSGSGAVLTKRTKNPKHKAHSKRSPSLPLHNINPSDVSSSTDYVAKSCGCSATKKSLTYQHNINKNTCDVNFIAIAETKVQNMERIANLTEKCTQRLSNLAKVLEEVRKNKSSAFNHLSTGESSSESDHKPNKKNVFKSFSQSHLTENNLEAKATIRQSARSLPAKSLDSSIEGAKLPEISFESTKSSNVEDRLESPKEYPSILEGIPKPGSQVSAMPPKPTSEINNNGDCLKRAKPPPALARMKRVPDDVIPHELSTVVEVDSPMSMKFKPQESLALDNKEPNAQRPSEKAAIEPRTRESLPNPDLLQSNVKLKPKRQSAKPEGSKFEMMDLNKFNEIMLKPFVSIEEFAKQCNAHELDEGSNIGDIPKDLMLHDDMSSMHSEGSLPDVIGELLKRNMITEPFKFDTASNVHSTTISSESSISVLALSKLNNKEKKRPYVSIVNREIAETSDTLSVSSNPDLENAFKNLGIGWASSTLKKTKERLALSSSSNSSSCSQKYMLKAFEKHEPPARKLQQNRNIVSVSTLKNAEQQTQQLRGVTVQEFLINDLANKITFNNKSQRDDTEQEFISLHETKMPDEMKHSNMQERSADNSGAVATRARTSTPVQLFKSLTYHSSSGSNNNLSNGLFSNVDDLSSVKVTSSSLRNHSTSDKDDLTIPNYSLILKRNTSDVSKSN